MRNTNITPATRRDRAAALRDEDLQLPGKTRRAVLGRGAGRGREPARAPLRGGPIAGVQNRAGKPIPYHGYDFRILTAQGPDALGGAYNYVAQGKLLGGFALVAYQAKWDSSGVMTFIVNQDGVVYQKDLGPKTAEIARAMKSFNPDSTWTKVETAGVGQP